jgi:hypothetical protein
VDTSPMSSQARAGLLAFVEGELLDRGAGGEIRSPEDRGPYPYQTQLRLPNLAIVFAYPPFPRGLWVDDAVVPTEWSHVLGEWLAERAEGIAITATLEQSVTFAVPARRIADTLARAAKDGADTEVFADLGPGSVGGVRITPLPSVAVAIGGPAATPASMVEAVGQLKLAAKALGPVSYAVLSIDETWEAFSSGEYRPPTEPFPYLHPRTAVHFCDEVVLDATHWQLVSSRHAERLGQRVPGVAIGDSQWEIGFGSPEAWIPGTSVEAQRAAARIALAPLLIDSDGMAYTERRSQERLETTQGSRP